MKKIVKIDLNNKVYGGRVYENQILELLNNEYYFERVYLMKYSCRILNIPRIIYLFIKYNYFSKDCLLLTNQTTCFAGKRSTNIAVIHHLDSSLSLQPAKLYQYFCDKFLYNHKNRFDRIITVASYWKKRLIADGFTNVSIIYNSFDIKDYTFSKKTIDDFKIKYNLTGKPIVYLGNCQKLKGVVESFNALKNIDAIFVTSGVKDVELPVENLFLCFEEYKILLSSADVVLTMSKFNEGWNRTAHEASLCGTPVIGSGAGGMGELLEIAEQQKITEYSDLENAVREALQYNYISPKKLVDIDLNYFKKAWSDVLSIKKISKDM